jgi:hypothetical protein
MGADGDTELAILTQFRIDFDVGCDHRDLLEIAEVY